MACTTITCFEGGSSVFSRMNVSDDCFGIFSTVYEIRRRIARPVGGVIHSTFFIPKINVHLRL